MKSFRTEKELELYYQKKSQKYKKKLSLLERTMIGGGKFPQSPFAEFKTLKVFYDDFIQLFGITGRNQSHNVFYHSLLPSQNNHAYELLTQSSQSDIAYIYVSGYAYRAFVKMVFVCSKIPPPAVVLGRYSFTEDAVNACQSFREAILHEEKMVSELLKYQQLFDTPEESDETSATTSAEKSKPLETIQGFYYIHLFNQVLDKEKHLGFLGALKELKFETKNADSFSEFDTFFQNYFGPRAEKGGESEFRDVLYSSEARKTGFRRTGTVSDEKTNTFRDFRQYKGVLTQQALIRLRDFQDSLEQVKQNHPNTDTIGSAGDQNFKNLGLSTKINIVKQFEVLFAQKKSELASLKSVTIGTNSKHYHSAQGDAYFQLDLLGTTRFGGESGDVMADTSTLLRDSGDYIWNPDAKMAIPNRTITTPLLFDLYQDKPVFFKEESFVTKEINRKAFQAYKQEVLTEAIKTVDNNLDRQFYETKHFPCMDTFKISKDSDEDKDTVVDKYLQKANADLGRNGLLQNRSNFSWLEPNVSFSNQTTSTLISTQQFYRKRYGTGNQTAILVYQAPESQPQQKIPGYAVFKTTSENTTVINGEDNKLLSHDEVSSKLLSLTYELKDSLTIKTFGDFVDVFYMINKLISNETTGNKKKLDELYKTIRCSQHGICDRE